MHLVSASVTSNGPNGLYLLLLATNGARQGYFQCLTKEIKYTKCKMKKRNRVNKCKSPSWLVQVRQSQALTNLNPIFR